MLVVSVRPTRSSRACAPTLPWIPRWTNSTPPLSKEIISDVSHLPTRLQPHRHLRYLSRPERHPLKLISEIHPELHPCPAIQHRAILVTANIIRKLPEYMKAFIIGKPLQVVLEQSAGLPPDRPLQRTDNFEWLSTCAASIIRNAYMILTWSKYLSSHCTADNG